VIVSWCYSKTQIWHQHAPLPFSLPSVRRKKLTIDFAGGNQSSNGGLLVLREASASIAGGSPKQCRIAAIRTTSGMFEMVMSRVLAIACGHGAARRGSAPLIAGTSDPGQHALAEPPPPLALTSRSGSA
jgi:hypothetical protein